jgi:hypothetical protein
MIIKLSFGRRFLLTGNGFARALSRTGVGPRALTSNGKPPAVSEAPITSDVHQSLDVHADIGPKVTFDGKFTVDDLTEPVKLFFVKLPDFFIHVDARFFANFSGRRTADAENIRERNFAPLVIWYVHSCNTRQSTASLPASGQKLLMKNY